MTIGTRTLGTTATTSLVAVQYSHVADGQQAQTFTNQLTPAAIATISALIKYDNQAAIGNQEFDPNSSLQTVINALGRDGVLGIPGRGLLRVRQGDIVAVDSQTGWPILVSAAAAASNPAWVLSAVTG